MRCITVVIETIGRSIMTTPPHAKSPYTLKYNQKHLSGDAGGHLRYTRLLTYSSILTRRPDRRCTLPHPLMRGRHGSAECMCFAAMETCRSGVATPPYAETPIYSSARSWALHRRRTRSSEQYRTLVHCTVNLWPARTTTYLLHTPSL